MWPRVNGDIVKIGEKDTVNKNISILIFLKKAKMVFLCGLHTDISTLRVYDCPRIIFSSREC